MSDSALVEQILAARRRDVRVPGPFDGRWLGLMTVPIVVHDLSLGGCLIQAFHEQAPGRRFTMEIELPYEGWVQLDAQSLYVRPGYGFAAKFLDTPPDTRARLEQVIRRLMAQTPALF